MNAPIVELLDHRRPLVACEICTVMAAAYEVEAEIIGAAKFPPLRRAAAGKLCEQCHYLGVRRDGKLVATAEIEKYGKDLVTIAALAVSPSHFRTGLGATLIRHILKCYDGRCIEVSTARDNIPALSLYAKLGFQPVSHWITPDGYHMQSLRFDCLSDIRGIG